MKYEHVKICLNDFVSHNTSMMISFPRGNETEVKECCLTKQIHLQSKKHIFDAWFSLLTTIIFDLFRQLSMMK